MKWIINLASMDKQFTKEMAEKELQKLRTQLAIEETKLAQKDAEVDQRMLEALRDNPNARDAILMWLEARYRYRGMPRDREEAMDHTYDPNSRALIRRRQ